MGCSLSSDSPPSSPEEQQARRLATAVLRGRSSPLRPHPELRWSCETALLGVLSGEESALSLHKQGLKTLPSKLLSADGTLKRVVDLT